MMFLTGAFLPGNVLYSGTTQLTFLLIQRTRLQTIGQHTSRSTFAPTNKPIARMFMPIQQSCHINSAMHVAMEYRKCFWGPGARGQAKG
jgi:hypothetical protein